MSKRKSPARRSHRNMESSSIWQERRRWFVGGGVAAAIALAVILAITFSGVGGSGEVINGRPDVSSANLAPDVTLVTLDGEFRLSENRGEVTLLYFSFPG